MAPQKHNKKALFGFAIIVIIVLGLMAYTGLQLTNSSGTTSTQDKTQLIGNNAGSDSTGTTTQGNAVSAQVWQSLYVVPTSGSAYWVEPSKPYNALDIYGSASGSGNDFTKVNKIIDEIDINPMLQGQTVASWQLSCQSTMQVTDTNGNIIGYIAQNQAVNTNGNTLTDGQNNYATGSTVTSAQLQSILQSAGASTGNQYYVVITLSNIQLTLNFQGGGYQTLTQATATDQNTASWLIKIS